MTEEFNVGDEIRIKSSVNVRDGMESVYIVTNIEKDLFEGCPFNWIDCISKNGVTYSNTSDSFEKTGRHFEAINEALELIRRASNE